MAAEDDPDGHYHALGLASNATQAQIAHAYREWAKVSHPDVTGRTDSGDFLRIKQAYDTLRDVARRQRYDATGRHRVPGHRPSRSTAAQAEARTAETRTAEARTAKARSTETGPHWADPPQEASQKAAPAEAESAQAAASVTEAVRCSVCGVISAQPRYCIFFRVISAVSYYRMDRVQGVFCRRCAAKKSLHESAISWLAGWWGFIGIFRTPLALWQNFHLGEKPNRPNARLLIAQAQYFLGIGNVALADACLQQAAGFAEGDDAMTLLRLRQSVPRDATRTIRDEWTIYRHPGALAHVFPLLVLAGVLVSQVASVASRTGVIKPAAIVVAARPAAPLPASMPPLAPDMRYVAAGSATTWVLANGKYISGGSLPQFTTVEVLAPTSNPEFVTARLPDGQAAVLAASGLTTGNGARAKLLWCNDPAQRPPYNGEIFRFDQSGPNRTVVTNAGSDDAVIKFRDLAGSVVVALFVDRQSQAVIADFPDGFYRFEFATGSHWNRKCGFFEQDMNAQRSAAVDTFASWEGTEIRQGRHVKVAHTKVANYRIPPPADADEQPQPIDQEAFIKN